MTFRVDFWVATATVAPVIALSATVNVGDNVKQIVRANASLIHDARAAANAYKLGFIAYIVNAFNIMAQLLALGLSLYSLAENYNKVPPTLLIALESLGLLGILTSALLNSASVLAISLFSERDEKRETGSEPLSVDRKSIQRDGENDDEDD